MRFVLVLVAAWMFVLTGLAFYAITAALLARRAL